MQVKQSAPIVPKMLAWPAISGLMFQMNVGIGGFAGREVGEAGPSSALATNGRERVVLGEAGLDRLLVVRGTGRRGRRVILSLRP